MLRLPLAILIVAATSLAAADDRAAITGTWSYNGPDAAITIRLDQNGDCFISAASDSIGGVGVQCHYRLEWPNVYVDGKIGAHFEPLRLVLVGDGALMRVEGEAGRPLRRVWDAPPATPPAIDLNKSSALADLQAQDPEGYRKVIEMVDLVQKHGCRGAILGEIRKLVRWEFISCASNDSPPEISHVGFWLGENRYFINIPPR